ncbi:DUF6668 family protein [Cellulomonas sp. Y8]|uniref:DUF6668 family protein n=1 Tax=Cellulomonas sp. Y8 TaxID=2591145 RepID=UPI003D734F63
MRRRQAAAAAPNPWTKRPEVTEPTAPAPAVTAVAATRQVWLIAAHGGAGVSTVSALTGLPVLEGPGREQGHRRGGVLVVTRTHAAGLITTQRLLGRASALRVPLAGLLLVADAPGRVPRQLLDLIDLVRGAVSPRPSGRLPWVPALRMRTPDMDPATVRALCPPAVVRDLQELVVRASGVDVHEPVRGTSPTD